MRKKYILFIDSGIGGLTTLCKTISLLNADFIYFADKNFAPYGNKSSSVLQEHLKKIIIKLSQKFNIVSVVLACNTATTSSVSFLRENFHCITFIGTEPAIKLAQDKGFLSPAIIATNRTIECLKTKISPPTTLVPSKDLATLIELNLIHPSPLNSLKLLNELVFIAKLTKNNDCLVLGCTHYPFIASKLKQMTNKPIFDGNQGVANRIFDLFKNNSTKSSVKIIISRENLKELQKYKKILKQILAKQIKL